jgi:hypothetical protein
LPFESTDISIAQAALVVIGRTDTVHFVLANRWVSKRLQVIRAGMRDLNNFNGLLSLPSNVHRATALAA